MPSDVKEAPSTQRCGVCGRETFSTQGPWHKQCLRTYGHGGATACYRLGYERLRERISFLEKKRLTPELAARLMAILKCETCLPDNPGKMEVVTGFKSWGGEVIEIEECAQCASEPDKVAMRAFLAPLVPVDPDEQNDPESQQLAERKGP